MILPLKTVAAGKAIMGTWLMAGISTFIGVDLKSGDVGYAAGWAAISALGAAFIAGVVKIIGHLITTTRDRRAGRQSERDLELKRMRDAADIERVAQAAGFEMERKASLSQVTFLQHQLLSEMTINKLKTASKHQLVNDIGARDYYISYLEEFLRSNHIEFEKSKFRNTAEASAQEDEQVQAIVQAALQTLINGPKELVVAG